MAQCYSNLEVIDPIWQTTAEQCAERGSAMGVHKPLPGSLWLNYFVLQDGSVRWKLVHQALGSKKQTQVAKWITNWLPPERIIRPPKPITTGGKVVTVNHGRAGSLERQIVVMIDALGLPVPVPAELLRSAS